MGEKRDLKTYTNSSLIRTLLFAYTIERDLVNDIGQIVKTFTRRVAEEPGLGVTNALRAFMSAGCPYLVVLF